jgi:hypothetical protein
MQMFAGSFPTSCAVFARMVRTRAFLSDDRSNFVLDVRAVCSFCQGHKTPVKVQVLCSAPFDGDLTIWTVAIT